MWLKDWIISSRKHQRNKHSSAPAFTHTIKVSVCCHRGRNTARERWLHSWAQPSSLNPPLFPREKRPQKPSAHRPRPPQHRCLLVQGRFLCLFLQLDPQSRSLRCARPTGRRNNCSSNTDMFINDEKIEIDTEFNYLGLMLDPNLSFKKHVKKMVRTIK